MSTVQTWQTVSTSLDDTLALAGQIGARLQGGELFELRSDLGGGKTAFVRGLAQGMGSIDTVHSPSFTICNQYKTDTLQLYHFDFYRLQDAGVMRNELAEVVGEPQTVIAIEWTNIVEDVLPDERITVGIVANDENKRQLSFVYPQVFNYLFPAGSNT